MNAAYLLVPILIPTASGLAGLRLPFKSYRSLCVYMEISALITSVVVWGFLLSQNVRTDVVYSFFPGFTLCLGIDGMSALYAGLVSLMWPIVLLYAFAYMKNEERRRSFFGFYILTYGATLGICFSANMLTLYCFFEMMSLATLPLVAHEQDHESLYAARKYAAYVIGGASLAFVSVVLTTLYGTSNFFVFGGNMSGEVPMNWMRLAYLFGFFGFGIKAAIFPLHKWLPTASCAPTPVTGLLHAVAVVNTGVFAIIRLTWYEVGAGILEGSWVQTVCLLAATVTFLTSSSIAVQERHMKRRLAYSTVSNLSYMLFGILLMTPEGLLAGTSHMIFHSVTKITLFLCIGAFMKDTGNVYLADVNGVGKRMPMTFVCYTVSALSLMGVPLLCCFVSKWRLLLAATDHGGAAAYIGMAGLIISSVLCAVYELSVVTRAFFPFAGTDRYAGQKRTREGGRLMWVPLVVFTVCQLVLGLHPEPLLNYITRISEGLL